MNKCFVIQPFDKGKYDKRYDDIFVPAIKAANLEPYRVDRDPSTNILIEDIQLGIESSRACLADITTDNPNIWFELGYAIAMKRVIVLVCSDERTTRFPFDVQHRAIITYSTESSRDFDGLRINITKRLDACLKHEKQINEIAHMSPTVAVEGLEQHEIATLVSVAQQIDDPTSGISTYFIRQDMEKAGFTKIATTLGLSRLIEKQMLEPIEEHDFDGGAYMAYHVTDKGIKWLFQNQDKLKLKQEVVDLSSEQEITF